MTKTYSYISIIAPYINDFIAEKRSLGYIYDSEAYILKHFDNYCIDNRLNDIIITKQFLTLWMTRRSSENASYQTKRISIVRGLLLFMNVSGVSTYIPHHFSKIDHHVPHILCENEVIAFFHSVDTYLPQKRYIRLANEYKILFRMIYCCGLRNSEACNLTMSNVDLVNGLVTILQSKGCKDRIVYLSDDLVDLCRQYKDYIKNTLGFEPYWYFPSSDVNRPFRNSTIDRKLNEIWNRTAYAGSCDHKPTVHGLRHSFVVRRMNLWMEQGIDFNVMMPYLSKYLGHKSVNETFYYYHQVEEAFRVIRLKDTISDEVIPEVTYEK